MEKLMSLRGRIFIFVSKACYFWWSGNHTHLTLDIWVTTFEPPIQSVETEDLSGAQLRTSNFYIKLSVCIFFGNRSIFHLDKVKFNEKGNLKMYLISSLQCALLVQINNYSHIFPQHILYKTSQCLCPPFLSRITELEEGRDLWEVPQGPWPCTEVSSHSARLGNKRSGCEIRTDA